MARGIPMTRHHVSWILYHFEFVLPLLVGDLLRDLNLLLHADLLLDVTAFGLDSPGLSFPTRQPASLSSGGLHSRHDGETHRPPASTLPSWSCTPHGDAHTGTRGPVPTNLCTSYSPE